MPASTSAWKHSFGKPLTTKSSWRTRRPSWSARTRSCAKNCTAQNSSNVLVPGLDFEVVFLELDDGVQEEFRDLEVGEQGNRVVHGVAAQLVFFVDAGLEFRVRDADDQVESPLPHVGEDVGLPLFLELEQPRHFHAVSVEERGRVLRTLQVETALLHPPEDRQ